jgi:hypothetical protein
MPRKTPKPKGDVVEFLFNYSPRDCYGHEDRAIYRGKVSINGVHYETLAWWTIRDKPPEIFLVRLRKTEAQP